MADVTSLIDGMRRVASTATSVAEVFRYFEDQTRDAPSDGLLVMSLVRGFGVPIPVAMQSIRWRGFGLPDGFDDNELEEMLSTWVLGTSR